MPGIDTAILDFTEWLCQRFQVLTGRTNVWIAVQLTNLSIIVYFFSAAIYFQAVHSARARAIAVALFCGGVLYVLTQTVFKESIKSAESNAYARVAKGLRNPRRLRDAPLRISFLTMSVLMVYPLVFIYMVTRIYVALLSYSLIALTTVLLYVIACDPLPPCVGKVRVWLRGADAPSAIPARELPVPIHAGMTSSCHDSAVRSATFFRPGGPLRSILPAGLKRDHMHTRTPDDHDDFGGLTATSGRRAPQSIAADCSAWPRGSAPASARCSWLAAPRTRRARAIRAENAGRRIVQRQDPRRDPGTLSRRRLEWPERPGAGRRRPRRHPFELCRLERDRPTGFH